MVGIRHTQLARTPSAVDFSTPRSTGARGLLACGHRCSSGGCGVGRAERIRGGLVARGLFAKKPLQEALARDELFAEGSVAGTRARKVAQGALKELFWGERWKGEEEEGGGGEGRGRQAEGYVVTTRTPHTAIGEGCKTRKRTRDAEFGWMTGITLTVAFSPSPPPQPPHTLLGEVRTVRCLDAVGGQLNLDAPPVGLRLAQAGRALLGLVAEARLGCLDGVCVAPQQRVVGLSAGRGHEKRGGTGDGRCKGGGRKKEARGDVRIVRRLGSVLLQSVEERGGDHSLFTASSLFFVMFERL